MNIVQVPSPHNRPRPSPIVINHITMHWMAGYISGADARFKANPQGGIKAPMGGSAHYGIAGSIIHQYVQENRRAGADGNGHSNDTGISIEHEGGYPTPNGLAKPSLLTHETSAVLCADIAKRYNLGLLVLGKNIFPHNHYVNTQCPGTLDISFIANRANEINNPVVTNTIKFYRRENEMIALVLGDGKNLLGGGNITAIAGPGFWLETTKHREQTSNAASVIVNGYGPDGYIKALNVNYAELLDYAIASKASDSDISRYRTALENSNE